MSDCLNCGTVTNPCTAQPANTAACETLPSQIENFTKQFFGEVTKSEVDGEVVWNLPCNLDVGLENNPREDGEGLACYFLRLFQDGIVGLTGPSGAVGPAGTNGYNAFSVLLASFTQPSLAAPTVQVSVFATPAIIAGMYVFIEGSGWFSVTATDGLGTLWLTLTQPIAAAGATIPAGRLVAPSGYPGASVTGPQGPQGPQGIQGTAGNSWTETNAQNAFLSGTDYLLQSAYAGFDFGSGALQVLLPDAGTYLVTAQVNLLGEAAVNLTDIVELRIRNTTDSVTVDGSYLRTSRLAAGEYRAVIDQVIVTVAGASRTLRIQGQATMPNVITVLAQGTTLSYIRIA